MRLIFVYTIDYYEIWKKLLKIDLKNKLFSLSVKKAKRNKHIKILQDLFPMRSL